MNEQLTGQLYMQVTKVTEEYLGPAAERFVARQISFHLNKSPETLSSEDLPKLIEWSKVTFGLLTDDRTLVDEYARRLTNLVEEKSS
jgi:hypothetical protein